MASRYSIAEARANLAALIAEAAESGPVELTRRGAAVAVLLSKHEYESMRGRRVRFGDAYREFRERFDLTEAGLEPEFVERLRDRGDGRPVDP